MVNVAIVKTARIAAPNNAGAMPDKRATRDRQAVRDT